MPVDLPPDRRVRGRWISADSAERNLGLLRRNELAQLRRVGTVHHADAGTVVAAHLLGARRQSVTRVVGDLKRRGLVESRYGHTLLRDRAGLRAVMGSEPLP